MEVKTEATAIYKHARLVSDHPELKADPANPKLHWAIASAELPQGDLEGDIIRVAGIDCSQCHDGRNKFLPILIGHMPVLPDGSPSVVGRVEEFRTISFNDNGNTCPALAFAFTLDDSELAQEYEAKLQRGTMGFSVGMMAREREPLQTGGMDFISCSLFEISLTPVPANQAAHLLRSLPYDMQALLDKALDGALSKQVRPLIERLDGIECALAILSKAASTQAQDRQKAESTKALHQFKEKLAKLDSFLGK